MLEQSTIESPHLRLAILVPLLSNQPDALVLPFAPGRSVDAVLVLGDHRERFLDGFLRRVLQAARVEELRPGLEIDDAGFWEHFGRLERL